MPDLGTFSLTGLGSGLQLYGPMAGLACIIALGHVIPAITKTTSSWSKTTRERLKATYGYLAASSLVWGTTAVAAMKLGLVGRGQGVPMLAMLFNIYAVYKTMSLDYATQRLRKASWFFGSCALQGLVLGQILYFLALSGRLHLAVQALALTAADVAAVSLFVMACPNAYYLWLGGPLAAGLGLMIGANIVQLLFRRQSILHFALAYLGAGLFSLFLLYDTSKVVAEAKREPDEAGGARPFDPINHALNLYTDLVQLFMYILRIFLEQDARSAYREEGGSAPGGGYGGYGERRGGPRAPQRVQPPGGFRLELR